MLNRTKAIETGASETSITTGMAAAQQPSAILRAASMDFPRRSKAEEKLAAQKAPDSGGGVWNPSVVTDLADIEAACVVKIFGQPKEEEVPCRVAHELGKDEGLHILEPDDLKPIQFFGDHASIQSD